MMKLSWPYLLTKTQWSVSVFLKSCSVIKESNSWYHYLGACLRPYKLFFSRHIKLPLPITSNPSGCSIWIPSSRSPCRNAILTSGCPVSKSRLTARLRTTQIDNIFTIGEIVSLKSIPLFWLDSLTSNQALYLLQPWAYISICLSRLIFRWATQQDHTYDSHARVTFLHTWLLPILLCDCQSLLLHNSDALPRL